MKVVEASKGRLVLFYHGVVSELAVALFMILFGVLSWATFPVDVELSLALLACMLLGGALFLLVAVRTTVIFDRIHNVVLIRRQSMFRSREREVALAEVAEATLVTDALHKTPGGGIVALAMRPGAARATVPLVAEGLPRREASAAIGAINDWLTK